MVDIKELARIGNDQFARLEEVPDFTVTSNTVNHGQQWPTAQYSGLMGFPEAKTSPRTCLGRCTRRHQILRRHDF